MRFFLGVGHLGWLASAGVPLFYAYPRIRSAKEMPQAAAPWALDSGGFSELQRNGGWTFSEQEYVDGVRRLATAGQLEFVCPMDWPCSPPATAATGLTVAEHQMNTVTNFLNLRELAPDLPWVPVLQGWTVADYHRHADLYERRGVALLDEPTVTVGSIANRQGDPVAGAVIRTLHAEGLRLHGLGVKTQGLAQYAECLASADSHGWPMLAELNRAPMCSPDADHQRCNSCQVWALMWREKMLAVIEDRIAAASAPALFDVDDRHTGHEPAQRAARHNPFTPRDTSHEQVALIPDEEATP